jgi:outer membrane protein assembly factor BamB
MSRKNTNDKKSKTKLIFFILICLAIGAFIGVKGGQYISTLLIERNVWVYDNDNNDDPSASQNVDSEAPDSGPSDNTEDTTNNEKDIVDKPIIKPDPTNDYPPSLLEGFASEVLISGEVFNNFNRSYNIKFGNGDSYASLEGVTCFRGNNYRDSASYGTAAMLEDKLEIMWESKISYIDTWSGVGWNGQPAIVKWPENVKQIMNLSEEKKNKKDLKEVIYATLDGNIYFLDLDDGKNTRPPINVGSPHKGSVTVDPRGYPLLYAGQGIPEVAGQPIPIKYRIFNLITQKEIYSINGMDKDAIRRWGAFDSGALIDAKTDSFLLCGENGLLYSGKLNTVFSPEDKTISINPELVKYRYKSPISTKIGVEGSPVIYKNFIYFADNSGLFQCVDLNTLKTIWTINVSDDTDSTPVLEETESGVYIYTACELDRQGEKGASYIRKLNAKNGYVLWEKKIDCAYVSSNNGGAFASPVLGKNDIQDLVIFNIAKTNKKTKNESTLIAINKETGEEAWVTILENYCWSSPVAIYDENGKSRLIACDSAGFMHLIDGKTGEILDKIPLGSNIEASPAVYDDMIVVGTRGCKIYGIKVK